MVQRSLYENIRYQLWTHSTPGKFKTKSHCFGTVRKLLFHFIWVRPSPKLAQLMIRRKSPMPGFSLGSEREEWIVHPAFWPFKTTQGTDFCTAWLGMLMRNLHTLDAWGTENKKEQHSFCGSSEEPVVLQTDTRGTRDYKLLKKKPANLSDCKVTQAQRRCIPIKGLRCPRISSRAVW